MPIATADEIITLAEMPTSRLGLVQSMMPILQELLCYRLQNWFYTEDRIYSATISFTNNEDDPDTINDSESDFLDEGVNFFSGMDIHVDGSKRNNGIYHVDTVVAGVLTLNPDFELRTEVAYNGIVITRVEYPQALKLPFALLMRHFVENAKRDASLVSRSLGGRSETYANATGLGATGGGDIPVGLLNQFSRWRRVGQRRISRP